MKVQDRTALVTGAGRGIGRAIALKLASEGARLVLNDLDPEPLAETVALVADAGATAVPCAGSIVEQSVADSMVSTAVDTFGGIDIIVNNAGYTWDSVIQKTTDEQWEAMLGIHLTAPFKLLRAAQPVISAAAKKEKADGRPVNRKVVNISSLAGLYGGAGQVAYGTGKAGIVGLTRSLAKEWGRYNVNVNAVAFGLIETRLTAAYQGEQNTITVDGADISVGVNPAVMETVRTMVPLGRTGTPDDAAGAVALLTYPESSYISGQVLVCGGGYEA